MTMRILAFLPLVALTASASLAAGNSADYNGDGKISKEEFRNEAARVSFAADKNQNGFVDADEAQLTDKQRQDLDANGDDKVSVEEFQLGQMKGFDQLDKNNDGFVDAGEMRGSN